MLTCNNTLAMEMEKHYMGRIFCNIKLNQIRIGNLTIEKQ